LRVVFSYRYFKGVIDAYPTPLTSALFVGVTVTVIQISELIVTATGVFAAVAPELPVEALELNNIEVSKLPEFI